MSKKTNVIFFETKPWEKKYILEKTKKLNINCSFSSQPLTEKNASKYKQADIIFVFIYSQINKPILSKLSHLKYIGTMSTGFDHIDLKECKQRGIKVSNVPYYGNNTVAEHTFALILSLSRKIPQSIEKVQNGLFSPEGLVGFDLKGKTIGLVGLGHIGQCTARIAHGFDMKILAFDKEKNEKIKKEYNIKYVSLNKLLQNSDIISLHIPYNKNTHHLINKKNIKLIKKGAYLINTSRGGLIDTKALLLALKRNIIAGAGLDVLEEESFIKEEKELLSSNNIINSDLQTVLRGHILIDDPRVIITPHNAFNSQEALERILDVSINNLNAFLKNKVINRVK